MMHSHSFSLSHTFSPTRDTPVFPSVWHARLVSLPPLLSPNSPIDVSAEPDESARSDGGLDRRNV